jgi:hypothetical protein
MNCILIHIPPLSAPGVGGQQSRRRRRAQKRAAVQRGVAPGRGLGAVEDHRCRPTRPVYPVDQLQPGASAVLRQPAVDVAQPGLGRHPVDRHRPQPLGPAALAGADRLLVLALRLYPLYVPRLHLRRAGVVGLVEPPD